MEQDPPDDLETLLSRALSAQLTPVATALDATARRLTAIEALAKTTAAGLLKLEATAGGTVNRLERMDSALSVLEGLAASTAGGVSRIESRLAPLELVTGFLAANTAAANVTKIAELEARILVLEQQRRSS